MDIPEFLEKLRGVKDKYVWEIVDKVLIRAIIKNKDDYNTIRACPIISLDTKDIFNLSIMNAYAIGRDLGLDIEDITRIMQASDGLYWNRLTKPPQKRPDVLDLRQQIIDILELKEVDNGHTWFNR
jgi:hypothetical protein